MFEIAIQRNIKDYKGKAFWGFTWRQIIWLALALGLNVPLYFWLKNYVPETITSYIVLAIGSLCFGIGFIPMNGMPLEKYLYYMFETTFLLPKKRIYRSITPDEAMIEEQYEAKLKRIKEIEKQLSKK